MKHPSVVAIFSLVASLSAAQTANVENEIRLGGFDLRLGMDQQAVLKTLTTVYEVTHVDAVPGNWSVARKGHRDPIGNVYFQNQKLASVFKQWGPAEQTASAFAMSLFNVIKDLTPGKARTCQVGVTPSGPTMTVIQCGNRTVLVSASTDPLTASGVSERLGGGGLGKD